MPVITLRRISRARAERIYTAQPDASDRWAEDYPLADELDALRFFLASPALSDHHQAFGLYSVHDERGRAVGGIGFFGPPDEEARVTIGYGIVPSARRRGYAAGAVAELLDIARQYGVQLVQAVTDVDNIPSQRVLLGAGFRELRRDEQQCYFDLGLG
ncbi:GNAT family N-acetyltransferase [Psychromicrobium lacuslunae]|uniref:N-acetyltransferase domain-containing protein n=1 Tax=Psychromicrobium lacuslunae TaxID=1618207 RepID=A0A0D4C0E4_9MICC|nr:GNAT family N-acetyltransferase [Psychromicrobium lacuslunae]AJT41890.1 hypothetical protein UM93_10865 [Psychromicrobium lacuslunae]